MNLYLNNLDFISLKWDFPLTEHKTCGSVFEVVEGALKAQVIHSEKLTTLSGSWQIFGKTSPNTKKEDHFLRVCTDDEMIRHTQDIISGLLWYFSKVPGERNGISLKLNNLYRLRAIQICSVRKSLYVVCSLIDSDSGNL